MLPLAERLRPKTLDEYIGQQHLVGEGAILRQMLDRGTLSSFILWGPPGVGKTTLARIIARQLERPFYTLSAVTSGVKDVRDVIDKAKRHAANTSGLFGVSADENKMDRRAVLFIDEIHRFSKSQQDSLLGAVEDGTITLIGATTENPSFEVITPLLSRCQVYVLKSLTKDDLLKLLDRVLKEDAYIKSLDVELKETDSILRYSGGDARKLLNIIELITNSGVRVIDNDTVTKQLQQNPVAYDKDGELHYDIISAFIKSIRGSDPDAALYWLARMIAAGEDPKFIARRLIISAAEDIGLANPNALLLANACFDSVHKIGFPEARIILAETTVYLATSAKSNSAYLAIDDALDLVKNTGNLPVPLHIRNAPTRLMAELGYGKKYKYPHDYPEHFTPQQYLPDTLQGKTIWQAQDNDIERKLNERMRRFWKE
jgi:putative ATPase